MSLRRASSSLVVAILLAAAAAAQERVPLIGGAEPLKAWKFNHGGEFPGAKGSLTLDAEDSRTAGPTLKLVGDFTGGGAYVQCGRQMPDDGVDVRDLSFRIRNLGSDRLTLRVIDGGGQVHQIALQTEATDEWQQVVLPLRRFFDDRGTAGAVQGIAKYEYWGGAKDGRWHGPAKAIYFLISPRGEHKVRTLYLSELTALARPRPVAGVDATTDVRLDEIIDGTHEWRFTHGPEFPGAKGSLTVVADEPQPGTSCLKLSGDFSGGGAYVAMVRELSSLAAASDVPAIRFRVKSHLATGLGVQLVDATGQTHQRKGVKVAADGAWHEIVLRPEEIAGGEHWGGADDGKWHGPPRQIALSVTKHYVPSGAAPELLLADMRAEARLPLFVQPPAYREDFENGRLNDGWRTEGTATVATEAALAGRGSLVLARELDRANEPCGAASPAFAVAPGRWEIKLQAGGELHSPDNSYRAVVELDCLTADGKSREKILVAETFGKTPPQTYRKIVAIPAGATAARLELRLDKTYGRFTVDDLSAAYLAPPPTQDDRIVRVLFSTVQLGNLLFPADPRRVTLTLEAKKPLRDAQRIVTCTVRDYWGAEQSLPRTVELVAAPKKNERLIYEGTLDLTDVPLDEGRYYEVHAAVPQPGAEPFRAFTSLAVLPESETKKYRPEEIPFASRNWDNRIAEYIRLTDRLGLRICGIWGGWSSEPPYKPHAPQLDLVRQLGMGWLTTTPCTQVERGNTAYDEAALRQGTKNFLEAYAQERPFVINLGNEPHGKGEIVLRNVAAYRAVYEEVKKFDPTIPVVATSVEPNEEYFAAGYGKYCDAYDFHIYEDSDKVRRTMEQYRALMKKYDVARPIWSTELGLNSQGMTRHVVAAELYKKFAVFFAAGGERVTWFGLLYPDAEGKSYGSSGDAHNVFDCRYNRYAPRLDAVAYYHAVNAIAIKKFVAERRYADDVRAYLFRDRDGRCLQILWKTRGRADVQVPLAGVGEVRVLRVDGSSRLLDAAGAGVTLSIDADPVLLLYAGGDGTLAAELPKSATTFAAPPAAVSRSTPTVLTVELGAASPAELELVAPFGWSVTREQSAGEQAAFVATPPAGTAVREAEFTLLLRDSARRVRGELVYRAPAAQ